MTHSKEGLDQILWGHIVVIMLSMGWIKIFCTITCNFVTVNLVKFKILITYTEFYEWEYRYFMVS